MSDSDVRFDSLWDDIADVGRARSGGYERFAWSDADRILREWFTGAAIERGLSVDVDRNGNQWAWWGDPDSDGPGIVVGSHLDSVPNGGAFDGPLGVVSALAAIDELRAESFTPARPIAVVNFVDEEGARFGVACAGSRLLTGQLLVDDARRLVDSDGTSWFEAARRAGIDADHIGRDEVALRRIGAFVELHVEQGRGLIDLGQPIALASAIWPHGRWRMDFRGQANHAGTTRLADRDDAMLAYARAVLEARAIGGPPRRRRDLRAGVRHANGVNAIPSLVTGSLDVRGPGSRRRAGGRRRDDGAGRGRGRVAAGAVLDGRDPVRRHPARSGSRPRSAPRRCSRPAPGTTRASSTAPACRPR